MRLLLKRFGAPVTTNAAAILYQHPPMAAANDILCVSIPELRLLLLRSEWRSCQCVAIKGGGEAMKEARRFFPPFPPHSFSLTPWDVCNHLSRCGTAHITLWLHTVHAYVCK